MKLPHNLKGLFEILLVLGMLLLTLLFFVTRSQSPEMQPTATILWPTSTPLGARSNAIVSPTTAPVIVNGKEPPACAFPLAQTTTVESKPEEYTFSEPKVVLDAHSNLYDIVEWLPDNQQVLITQDLQNSIGGESDKFLRQSIELYDPQTGQSKVYAIRHHTDEPPSWQPDSNTVVYPDMNILGIDSKTHQLKFTRQVWVSHGDPKAAQMLADNLPQLPLAVKLGGSETVYLSAKQLSRLDGSLKAIPSVPFDPTQWDYAKGRRSEIPPSYKMAWQPGTALIFLYADGVFRFDGYTFILNTDTGQVCELNLGGWATKAHWSSNGRYLAIIRTHDHFPISSSDLAVLDTATGNVTTTGVTSSKLEGKHFVDDMVWAPDNRHLSAVGRFLPFQYTNQSDKNVESRLYLVDSSSGQSDDILPTYTFYADSLKSSLAWSPDSSKLLIRCPTMIDERICFILVQKTGK